MRLRQRTLLVTAACALFLVWEIFYECRTCHVTKGGDKAPHQRFLDSPRQNVSRRSSLTMGVHKEDAAAVLDKPTGASAYEIDSFLEGPLPVAFKEVLQKYPVVPSEDVKIVLIVAYYRSGSSFFGELMSSTPLTFFHYEPLMLFTVSGGIRPGRQYHAFQLLNALVRCRFEPLYTVWMETTPHYKHNHFLTDVCEGGESCFSPGHLAALCSRAKTQVFKFTRLRVRQVQTWMQQNPGIAHSARVVHLVRDPRGIYFSRRGLRWCTDYKHCDSPAMLCDQIRSDLDAFGELSRQMPNDRIYQIRFEDISVDPLNETKRLFTRLGLDFAPSVSRYIENHTTRVALEMKNAHSTRRDPREVAEQWKRKLTVKKIRQIEAACSDVLKRLGYKTF